MNIFKRNEFAILVWIKFDMNVPFVINPYLQNVVKLTVIELRLSTSELHLYESNKTHSKPLLCWNPHFFSKCVKTY